MQVPLPLPLLFGGINSNMFSKYFLDMFSHFGPDTGSRNRQIPAPVTGIFRLELRLPAGCPGQVK